MLGDIWDHLPAWVFLLIAVADFVLVAAFMVWVVMTKTESASAVAWLLLLLFLPFVGVVLFFFFGYQHVHRPLRRKRRHRALYQDPPDPAGYAESKQQSFPGDVADRGLRSLGDSLSQ